MDEYIISKNATQSTINAGYSSKTAAAQGSRLLRNVKIQEAMKERSESMYDERTMSVKEALAISSSIARGEPQKGYSKQVDKQENEVLKEIEFEFTPSIEERQRSLEHILKVNGAFIDRQEIDAKINTDKLDNILNQLRE